MTRFKHQLPEQFRAQVEIERGVQDDQWGGPEHDDTHSPLEWIGLIAKHIGKAGKEPFSFLSFKYQMVRVAALACAAWEWADRHDKKAGS